MQEIVDQHVYIYIYIYILNCDLFRSNPVHFLLYVGVSINNQPIPFPMDRDDDDFHALFQYMGTK